MNGPYPTGLVSLLEEDIQTQRSPEGPCEDAGRRCPSMSQGERPSEETNDADTLISNFWPPELRINLCFKPLTLLWLPSPPSISLSLSHKHTQMHTLVVRIWHLESKDHVCVLSYTVVSNSLWPIWTAARQAPLSMGFSRQEYWSGWPLPSPGDLPDPGVKFGSSVLQVDSLPSDLPGKPLKRPYQGLLFPLDI